MSENLDAIDRGIIEILRRDARTPFTEVGKELGISDATVHVRVKKMMEMGVIKGYTIEVDEGALGRRITGFVLLNVRPGTVEDVSRQLAELERVSEVHEVHGSEDLIVKIGERDLDRLRSVILKVRGTPNVVESEFFPVFKTWKD